MEQDTSHGDISSLPADYWSQIDPAFSADVDPQHPPHQHQQPQGITWDHPVLQQQQHRVQSQNLQPRPSSQSGLSSHTHAQDIFATPPQSWQYQQRIRPTSSSVSSPQPNYSGPTQTQYQQIDRNFTPGSLQFTSSPLTPSSNVPYQQHYSYSPQYYSQPQAQPLNVSETYSRPQPRPIAPHPGHGHPSVEASANTDNQDDSVQGSYGPYILQHDYQNGISVRYQRYDIDFHPWSILGRGAFMVFMHMG
jgi:hypothetical protein